MHEMEFQRLDFKISQDGMLLDPLETLCLVITLLPVPVSYSDHLKKILYLLLCKLLWILNITISKPEIIVSRQSINNVKYKIYMMSKKYKYTFKHNIYYILYKYNTL